MAKAYLTACAFTYSKLKSSLCPCPFQPSNGSEYSQEYSSTVIFSWHMHIYNWPSQLVNFITLFPTTSFPQRDGQTEIEETIPNFPLQRCRCCCAPISLPEFNAARLFCMKLLNTLLLTTVSPSSLLLRAQCHVLCTAETGWLEDAEHTLTSLKTANPDFPLIKLIISHFIYITSSHHYIFILYASSPILK